MPARICVILNPSAKGGRAERFRKEMIEFQDECVFKLTTHAGAGAAMAAQAVREGFETIVAAGGDGTVNEVLNGIAGEPDGLARARLAVLPVGTVNVFARELKLPLKIRRAWETIRAGAQRSIDLPWIEFRKDGQMQRRYFAQLAGAGFDARAIALVSWDLKKRIGPLAYGVAALQALRTQPRPLLVRRHTERLPGDFVIIGNGRLYAGSIPICPRANNADGLLDVCLFQRTTLGSLARHICACLAPRLRNWSPTTQFQASTVEVEGDADTPLEVDGEWAGRIPARCQVEAGRLRVVVPG